MVCDVVMKIYEIHLDEIKRVIGTLKATKSLDLMCLNNTVGKRPKTSMRPISFCVLVYLF